jgi:glutamate synthase domain-containing protein 3
VQLRVDGGFKTGRDVVLATMLGADMCGFGTMLLVALGCIYARQCHLNTCPVGIATQDLALRAKYKGTAEEAETFFAFIAADVRRRLAAIGASSLEEIRGRSDLLRPRASTSERQFHVDLSEVLRLPEDSPMGDVRLEDEPHVDDIRSSKEIVRLRPADRAVGARLAHDIAVRRTRGEAIEPQTRRYTGSAGQSFGAFLTDGLRLELDGDANDYVGKSMEGGTIVIRNPGAPDESLIGNACFYGARGGSAYADGLAGERLAVRNSGAHIVVEGAGAHACEYMTAGAVAILGPVGRNVASGMTGGEAFILADESEVLDNLGPTDLRPHPLDAAAATRLCLMLEEHVACTGSARARVLLAAWAESVARFVRLAPGLPPLDVTVAASAPSPRWRHQSKHIGHVTEQYRHSVTPGQGPRLLTATKKPGIIGAHGPRVLSRRAIVRRSGEDHDLTLGVSMKMIDLRTLPPRHPLVKLDGLIMLPRTIDKARALLADTIGDYELQGLSTMLLDALGISAADFLGALTTCPCDADVVAWIRARSHAIDREAINALLLDKGSPESDVGRLSVAYPWLPTSTLRRWVDIAAHDDEVVFGKSSWSP